MSRNRQFKYTWNVAKWLGDAEMYVPDLPPAVVLALIHVESNGDEFAQRPGSQYHGLLQMGRAAGIDVGFRDMGVQTTQKLKGDGPAGLRAFAAYITRYAAHYKLDPEKPEWFALLWKGGPGYLKAVKAIVDSNMADFDKAVIMVGEDQNFSAADYITEFRNALAVWQDRTTC